MSKPKLKADPKIIECLSCKRKSPSTISNAHYLIYVRKGFYDLAPGTAEIDKRLMGVCKDCIEDKTDFQRDINRRFPVDPDNKDLVYRVEQ